jgi:hypothetical protein
MKAGDCRPSATPHAVPAHVGASVERRWTAARAELSTPNERSTGVAFRVVLGEDVSQQRA